MTNDDFIPSSWKEKNQLHLKVSRAIRDLRKDIAIDLIVHSKKMYEEFIKSQSMFSKEIKKGLVIYG